MATPMQWFAATRPRTLPAAVAPVLVGAALAYTDDALDVGLSVLAAIVALSLQIGVNYSNDYSDGIRGTDEVRIGPTRLVGQGLASASSVRRAAFAAFGAAACAGAVIVWLSGHWVLLIVGFLAIVSAWYYTGGENPYGYLGLGELFVFIWFGLVAVNGTLFVQTGSLGDARGWILGAGSGALSCALLVANNLRDVPTDAQVGKRTLAVRIGDHRTRLFFAGLLLFGMSTPFALIAVGEPIDIALGLCVLPFFIAHKPGRAVLNGATGAALLPVLAGTGQILLLWALTTSAALLF